MAYDVNCDLCVDSPPPPLVGRKADSDRCSYDFGEVQQIIFSLHRLISVRMIVCKLFSLY